MLGCKFPSEPAWRWEPESESAAYHVYGAVFRGMSPVQLEESLLAACEIAGQ